VILLTGIFYSQVPSYCLTDNVKALKGYCSNVPYRPKKTAVLEKTGQA